MPRKKRKKFWNFADLGNDTAELTLEGEITDYRPKTWDGKDVSGDFIVSAEFEEEWQNVKNKKNLIIKVNSPGGDLFTGLAMRNKLASYTGNLKIINMGIMASAASLMATLKNATVQAYQGSIFMIHGVSGFLMGYYNQTELKKTLKEMKAFDKSIAKYYAVKMNIEEDKIEDKLLEDTYYIGQEAIDIGLADEMLEEEAILDIEVNDPEDKQNMKIININGYKTSGFNALQFLNKVDPAKIKKVHEEKEEEKIMDEKELMEKYGDMINTIVNKAVDEAVNKAVDDSVAKERARIKEIEEIQNMIDDDDLINEAKYGEKPMEAKDLAFVAMKNQKAKADNYLNDRNNQAVQANKVNPNPKDEGKEEMSKDEKDIKDAVDSFNKMNNLTGGKF